MDLVLADTRLIADLTLELSFVLTTKTFLSKGRDLRELPMRFDVLFEEYMKLAGLLLEAPLDFSQSSHSLREFAKIMQKNGFISLDAGLTVTEIHHGIIDDIYPDSTIFGGAISDEGDDDLLADVLDTSELTSDDESAGLTADALHRHALSDKSVHEEQCARTDCRDDGPIASVQRNKTKQLRKLLLLKDLCDRQERKEAWIQQKVEKQAKNMLEKEMRKTNMKSNVDRVRGQKDKGDKYQTLLSKDADALAFYAKHAGKKTRGSKPLKMMLAIQHKTGHLQQQLRDMERTNQSAILRILGAPSPPVEHGAEVAHAHEANEAAHLSKDLSVEGCIFERLDDGASRARDDRGAQKEANKARQSKVPAGAPASAPSEKTMGANYKVVRELRAVLKFLGFTGSRDLAELPEFEELRLAHKKALLSVHPDKLTEQKNPAADAPDALDFYQLQERHQQLLARYYDTESKDFTREVKAHRKSQLGQSRAKKEGAGAVAGADKVGNKAASKGLRWHRPKGG